MKIISTLILFLVFALNVNAQNAFGPIRPGVHFLDQNKRKCPKEDAQFKRVGTKTKEDPSILHIQDYSMEGELLFEGNFKKINKKNRAIGIHQYYSSSKSLEKTLEYQEEYADIIVKNWYPNGRMKMEGLLIKNDKDKRLSRKLMINAAWNEDGHQTVSEGNGIFEGEIDRISFKGELIAGEKHGLWKGFTEGNALTFEETYQNGEFIKGKSTTSTGEEFTYDEITKKAEIIGGMPAFYRFIGRKVRYPEVDRKRGTQGKVFVKISIDKKGKCQEVKVIKGISPTLNAEAK
ncbi:energy transducer TonB [Persicobacter diffluens]|uniref:TonB C-terminal domain-containing protein n=1 Tax=Persicobacter diffluens TaxID=981 RepID=A0AAN4W3V0_9BACT|nr:hypothetical protein PEDI_40520 [Persicobacter diffluens]